MLIPSSSACKANLVLSSENVQTCHRDVAMLSSKRSACRVRSGFCRLGRAWGGSAAAALSHSL